MDQSDACDSCRIHIYCICWQAREFLSIVLSDFWTQTPTPQKCQLRLHQKEKKEKKERYFLETLTFVPKLAIKYTWLNFTPQAYYLTVTENSEQEKTIQFDTFSSVTQLNKCVRSYIVMGFIWARFEVNMVLNSSQIILNLHADRSAVWSLQDYKPVT